MPLFMVLVMTPVRWIVSENDPPRISLPGLPGWALVNPGMRATASTMVYRDEKDGATYVETNEIAFAVTNQEPNDEALQKAHSFLRWLRASWGQGTLGVDIGGSTWLPESILNNEAASRRRSSASDDTDAHYFAGVSCVKRFSDRAEL